MEKVYKERIFSNQRLPPREFPPNPPEFPPGPPGLLEELPELDEELELEELLELDELLELEELELEDVVVVSSVAVAV